jgi:hypothetical protein
MYGIFLLETSASIVHLTSATNRIAQEGRLLSRGHYGPAALQPQPSPSKLRQLPDDLSFALLLARPPFYLVQSQGTACSVMPQPVAQIRISQPYSQLSADPTLLFFSAGLQITFSSAA